MTEDEARQAIEAKLRPGCSIGGVYFLPGADSPRKRDVWVAGALRTIQIGQDEEIQTCTILLDDSTGEMETLGFG